MVSVGKWWEFPKALETERRSSPYPNELKQEQKAKAGQHKRAKKDFGGRV